jgi:hypothetical protein
LHFQKAVQKVMSHQSEASDPSPSPDTRCTIAEPAEQGAASCKDDHVTNHPKARCLFQNVQIEAKNNKNESTPGLEPGRAEPN